MKKFMIRIEREEMDKELLGKFYSEEKELISQWHEQGLVTDVYVRERAGIYAVMEADSEEIILEKLKMLPLYKWLTFTLDPLK